MLEGDEVGVVPWTQVSDQFLNEGYFLIMTPLLFPFLFPFFIEHLDKFFLHPWWRARLTSRKLGLLRHVLVRLFRFKAG